MVIFSAFSRSIFGDGTNRMPPIAGVLTSWSRGHGNIPHEASILSEACGMFSPLKEWGSSWLHKWARCGNGHHLQPYCHRQFCRDVEWAVLILKLNGNVDRNRLITMSFFLWNILMMTFAWKQYVVGWILVVPFAAPAKQITLQWA